MATFPTKPTLAVGESPSKYDITEEPNEAKAPTEGGYEFRRKRFTRATPEIVSTGFTGLKHADYLVLRAFWKQHTTVVAFTYFDYMLGINRTVRFEEPPKWNPESIGTTRLWSPTFKMKEV